MRIFLLVIFLFGELFAISPYSLEGIKDLNIKISDKSKLLSKEKKMDILKRIEDDLHTLGVKTSKNEFSNLVVKIEGIETKGKYVLNISLLIVENVHPTRNQKIQGLGLTYMKNDMFEVEDDLEKEIELSIFKLLFDDFKKQYQEENN